MLILATLGLQLIAEGQTKLASVPSGGAAPAASAGAAAGGAAAEAAPAEEKKEEAKEEYVSRIFASICSRPDYPFLGPTTTWASVFSTKRLASHYLGLARHGLSSSGLFCAFLRSGHGG